MLMFFDEVYEDWLHFSVVGFGPSPYTTAPEYVYIWLPYPVSKEELESRKNSSTPWKFNGPHIDRTPFGDYGILSQHLVCPD